MYDYQALTLTIPCSRSYSLPSVGPGADPGIQAVSPQVTFELFAGGRLPLLSTRPASLPRKHSPGGATTDWGGEHIIAAHYSFIDPERMKGWDDLVGWPQRTVYPHKWSPISWRSSVRRGKFAGQRPTFYHCATTPTTYNYTTQFHHGQGRFSTDSDFKEPWKLEKNHRLLKTYKNTVYINAEFSTTNNNPNIGL